MAKKINRVLIEMDAGIYTGYCDQYERLMEKHFNNSRKEFDKFFNIQIVDAGEKKKEVIAAITKYNEIWIDTSLIGDSGRLLVEMMQYAITHNLTGKKLINMRKWTDVMWHIPDEARPLIKQLSGNDIEFIYEDDDEYFDYLPK